MNARSSFALLITGVLFGICATGCLRNADASPPTVRLTSSAPDAGGDGRPAVAPAPDDTAAAQAALKWLLSLRHRDGATLIRQSGVPFVLRDASSNGDCSKLDIADSSKLTSLICIVRDDVLHQVLNANPDPEPGLVSPKHLPKWARKWKADVTPELTPVSFVLLGTKASFDLVVLVGADGVRGLFKYAAGDRL